MKLYSWKPPTRPGTGLCLVLMGLLLMGDLGCQSMMVAKSKKKERAAQDRFSCGESLPGRAQQ